MDQPDPGPGPLCPDRQLLASIGAAGSPKSKKVEITANGFGSSTSSAQWPQSVPLVGNASVTIPPAAGCGS